MHPDFWHERWQQGQIGFHRNDANPWLIQHWHTLDLSSSTGVFVPLCGKTQDLLWLRAQGYEVVGVEVSRIAVEAFFEENGLAPVVSSHGLFTQYACDGIRILCGDFFDLTPQDLEGVRGCYDRASLIAFPPEMRSRYAQHLVRILPPGAAMLLVAFDYPQSQLDGPPFSVDGDEVVRLYAKHADLKLLQAIDILEQEPRFRAKGLTRLSELVYLIRFA